jgi:effector-binding domain-containing protein/DNA-binding transcriptional MerR regulator
LFRIGDFSRLTKVSIKAFRYYDELGLLKPVKVDDITGYRYYSATQLPRLNKILTLKDLGFSLSQVTEIIDSELSTELLTSMLTLRKLELTESIKIDQQKLFRIQRLLTNINEEVSLSMLKYDVLIKKVEPLKIASIRDIIPNYSSQGHIWEELVRYLNQNNVKIVPPCLVICYDTGYKESNVDVEIAEHIIGSAPGNGRVVFRELESVEEMAYVVHKGSYETLNMAYGSLMKWIEDSGYKIAGPNRELYLEGEWSVKSPDEYITEIQIPVTKA